MLRIDGFHRFRLTSGRSPASRGRKLCTDMREHKHVIGLAKACWSLFPSIKPTHADVQCGTRCLDWNLSLLCIDQRETHPLVSLASKRSCAPHRRRRSLFLINLSLRGVIRFPDASAPVPYARLHAAPPSTRRDPISASRCPATKRRCPDRQQRL